MLRCGVVSVCLMLLAGTCCAARFPLLLFDTTALSKLHTTSGESADAFIQRNSKHSLSQQKLEALLAHTPSTSTNSSDRSADGNSTRKQTGLEEEALQQASWQHLLLPGQSQVVAPTDLWPLQALAANLQDDDHAFPTFKKLLHRLDAHWSHLRANERKAGYQLRHQQQKQQQQQHEEGEGRRRNAGPLGHEADERSRTKAGFSAQASSPALSPFAAIDAWAAQTREQAEATKEGACLCATPLTCHRGCRAAEAAIRAARSFFNLVITADLIFDACSHHEQAFLAEQVLWNTDLLVKVRRRASLPPMALSPVLIAINQAVFAGSLFVANVRSHYSLVAARVSASTMRIDALAGAQPWLEDAWAHLRMGITLLSRFAPDGSLDGDLSLSLTTSQILLETWLMAQNNAITDAYTVHPLGWVRRHAHYIRAILPPYLWARRQQPQPRDAPQHGHRAGSAPVLGVPAVGEACEHRGLACSPAMQLRFVDGFSHQSGESTWLADRISEVELFGINAVQGNVNGSHICVFSLLAELAILHPRLPPIAPFVRRTEAMRLHRFHHKGLVAITQGGAGGASDSPIDASPRQLLFTLRAGFPSADTSLLASTLDGSAYAHMIPELMKLVHAPALQEGSFTFTPDGERFIVAPTGHVGNVLFVTPAAAPFPFEPVQTRYDNSSSSNNSRASSSCAPGFQSMATESLWKQRSAPQTRGRDAQAGGQAGFAAEALAPQVLYSSSQGSQALVVASTRAAYASAPSGMMHPGLLCSVRVSFLPFPDTLILMDMVMVRTTSGPSVGAGAGAAAHLLFQSAQPWKVNARQSSAATTAGHTLLTAQTIVVDAKGHRTLRSLNRPGSPMGHNADTAAGDGEGQDAAGDGEGQDAAGDVERTHIRTASSDASTLMITHDLVAAGEKTTSGKTERVQLVVLGTLLAGRSRSWTGFELTCQDCTLQAAKHGRMRLKAALSCRSEAEGEACGHSFPLHVSRQEACPV